MKLTHPIVSTQWLADNLDMPGLRIFDASVYLTVNPDGPGYNTESGLAKWREAHIPGANLLEMLTEFLDNSGSAPLMMHPPEHFAELCARHGIGDDSTVVIYSGQSMMWSARMWWMLRTVGFTNAAILDGGWEKWQREGRATSSEDKPYPPATFTPRPRAKMWADKAEVLQAVHAPSVCTINALQPDIYDGQVNRYGRAGHIPGSHNVYYNSLLNPDDGTYLPPDKLRQQFEPSGTFDRRTIVYCGGGVSAGLDAIALTMLGHDDIAIYDGSMFEWCADPALPLVTGSEPG
jgi:thiosulfate/3-mercaptopyruvate sulfurtransferase